MTDSAPPPVGPYTPVVRAGDWLAVSGQVGIGPLGLATGFSAQLELALENLAARIAETGARLEQVVRTTVYLVDMADYDALNEGYTAFFDAHTGGHRPARSAVAVAALPIGARVEIDAWVHDPR